MHYECQAMVGAPSLLSNSIIHRCGNACFVCLEGRGAVGLRHCNQLLVNVASYRGQTSETKRLTVYRSIITYYAHCLKRRTFIFALAVSNGLIFTMWRCSRLHCTEFTRGNPLCVLTTLRTLRHAEVL